MCGTVGLSSEHLLVDVASTKGLWASHMLLCLKEYMYRYYFIKVYPRLNEKCIHTYLVWATALLALQLEPRRGTEGRVHYRGCVHFVCGWPLKSTLPLPLPPMQMSKPPSRGDSQRSFSTCHILQSSYFTHGIYFFPFPKDSITVNIIRKYNYVSTHQSSIYLAFPICQGSKKCLMFFFSSLINFWTPTCLSVTMDSTFRPLCSSTDSFEIPPSPSRHCFQLHCSVNTYYF